MEDQDVNQDHVVIEMDLLDPRPFARAAAPTIPRDGTRQHRTTPIEPVGALDGRQIRRLSVHPPRQRRHSPTGEETFEESVEDEAYVDREVTEAERQWCRFRGARGREDQRSLVSSEYKLYLIISTCIVILVIVICVAVWATGGNGGQWESVGGNSSVSTPLDDLRSSMYGPF